MCESDWFTKENMTKWEEKDEQNKTWDMHKSHFEKCYTMCKQYNDAKGTKVEDINRIDAEANHYWNAMAAQMQKIRLKQ